MGNYKANEYQSNACRSEEYLQDQCEYCASCASCASGACGRSRRCCGVCSNKVLGFIVVALAAALGLIFGAVYAEQIFAALPAVIVFAAVMVIAIIALLLYRFCDRC